LRGKPRTRITKSCVPTSYFFNLYMKDTYKRPEADGQPPDPPAWQKIIRPDGRVVWAPNRLMKAEQLDLLYNLEAMEVEFEHATGGIKGSNVLKNALRHAGNRYFFQLDLQGAYGQVDLSLLAHKLYGLGFQQPFGEPEEIFDRLNDFSRPPDGDGLIQGGAASPLLFNLYCLDLDIEIGKYCKGQGMIYSRYLDDLTFSSPDHAFRTQDAIGRDKRRTIRDIIVRHNMSINESKTRSQDLQRGPVTITGVQINVNGKLQLATRYLRHARSELRRMVMESPDIKDAVQYASGLNGLLKAVRDPDRPMSEDEVALYLEVQDVLVTYGADLADRF